MDKKIKLNWAREAVAHLCQTEAINSMAERSQTFAIRIMQCIRMFRRCNWGNTSPADCKLNDHAVEFGDARVVARYKTIKGDIFIITEHDRSVTTVLFANEY